jgi:hypothetical protein
MRLSDPSPGLFDRDALVRSIETARLALDRSMTVASRVRLHLLKTEVALERLRHIIRPLPRSSRRTTDVDD